MLTELFLHLSILTGLEPVPLQNLACSLASLVVGVLAGPTWRLASRACRRTPVALSKLASDILARLQSHAGFTRHANVNEVQDGTLLVRADVCYDTAAKKWLGPVITVNAVDKTGHLSGRERRDIYARCRAMVTSIKADEVAADLQAAIQALAPVSALQEPTKDEPTQAEQEDTDYLNADNTTVLPYHPTWNPVSGRHDQTIVCPCQICAADRRAGRTNLMKR